MPETFPDGFPMTPAEAIEYSYFFSETEKQDWREWLTTASSQEQAELVDMLHKIWLDKQKQAVPNQFAANTYSQAQPVQNFDQISPDPASQFTPQSDFYDNHSLNSDPFGDPLNHVNDSQSVQKTNQGITTDLSSFNYEPEPSPALNQNSNFQSNPDFNHSSAIQQTPPDFDFDHSSDFHSEIKPISVSSSEKHDTTEDSKSTNHIDDFDFNFDDITADDSTDLKPKSQTEEEQNTEPDDKLDDHTDVIESSANSTDKDNEIKDFYHEQHEDEVTPTQTPNLKNDTFDEDLSDQTQTEPKLNPSFSISKIREGATSLELDTLYQNYLNNRSSLSSSKLDHDHSYDELMQKVISIVLNFETVADYLEFMVTKLSEMNETIIKQAEEIANFKNGQNNHAHDLEQTLNQVLSKIQTIEKNQNLDFDKYRTRLDNLEIRHTGQKNSAYSEYDNLNTQIDLLKSKLIKIEKEVVKTPETDKTNTSAKLVTTIPVPKSNYQSHLPLSQKLKDFTTKADQ